MAGSGCWRGLRSMEESGVNLPAGIYLNKDTACCLRQSGHDHIGLRTARFLIETGLHAEVVRLCVGRAS